jgi:glutamate-1-semialdehyde 2,1-aminomutase
VKSNLDLLADAGRYLAGGVLHHATALRDRPPIVVVKAHASRIWSADGNRYIDYYMGSASLPLGHADPEIIAAVEKQQALGTHFFELTPPAIELAELIVEMVPSAERVKFATSGTEAVLAAVRVARAVTGRTKIVKFEGAYHGSHDPVLWGYRPHQRSEYPLAQADSLGIPIQYGEHVLLAPYNDAAVAIGMIEKFRGDIAAVLIEPVLGNIEPAAGFLESLREVTSTLNIPLIFDEVVTGFRLAAGGAQEYYHVTPDLTALGKSLGGGYPIGAIAGRSDLMEMFSPKRAREGQIVRHVGTHSGNPVSCAAAVATLRVLRRPGSFERLHAVAQKLADGLRDISRELGIETYVVNVGPMVDIWFTNKAMKQYTDYQFADANKSAMFKRGLLDRGIWSPPGLKFFLSLAHSDEDIEETLAAARELMRAV